jgi:hypothetical protein
MKFNAYGRKIEVVRSNEKWEVFFLGDEGKKRIAQDIFIPSDVRQKDLKNYLEDILHEWAAPENDQVIDL